MPKVLDIPLNDRFTKFYTHGSSIAHANKYIIEFYGPKVTAALNIINASANKPSNWKELLNIRTDSDEGKLCNAVELNWACSEVSIPTGDITVDKSSHFFDYEKAIKHPYILGIQEVGELKLKIIDTKEMIWYQFFNAIKNSFFEPHYFRPVGSSFNKLACYIQVLQGSGTADIKGDGLFKPQLFEFNSMVPVKFDALTFKHNDDEPFSFHITFQVPNVFQDTYNTKFKGLRNMATYASDSETKNSVKQYYLNTLETSAIPKLYKESYVKIFGGSYTNESGNEVSTTGYENNPIK